MQAAKAIRSPLDRHLTELEALPVEQLIENRYQKYRNIGDFIDPEA